MNKIRDIFANGIIRENPVFIQTLGMCPLMAVTTSMMNGLGMGMSTLFVLVLSNFIISLLRKFIPDSVRVPSYIVVVASLVTILQFLLQGFIPALNDSLGIYIPLIVVNCIILGRAESFASKNPVIPSVADGVANGLGFTMALGILGFFRELIGSGAILTPLGTGEPLVDFTKINIGGWVYEPASIMVLAPGAFLVLAFVVATMNRLKRKKGLPPADDADLPEYLVDAVMNKDGAKEVTEAPNPAKVVTNTATKLEGLTEEGKEIKA